MFSGKSEQNSSRRAYGARRAFVHCALLLALALPAGAPAQAPAPAAVGAQDVHIFALGDSLTAGFGLPRELGFVPQLEAHLRRHGVRARVFNAGVSGDTAAQGRQRLAWTVDGLPQPPRLAIVALGGNDMLRGLPPRETRAALDAILTELKGRNMRLLVAGMVAAPNLGADYARAFNGMYGELAQEHGATLQPFFLEGVAGQRALNQPDGIHPNLQGVKVMVAGIAPRVIEALGQ
jgi:acyl-CoA thioesterase-1